MTNEDFEAEQKRLDAEDERTKRFDAMKPEARSMVATATLIITTTKAMVDRKVDTEQGTELIYALMLNYKFEVLIDAFKFVLTAAKREGITNLQDALFPMLAITTDEANKNKRELKELMKLVAPKPQHEPEARKEPR